MHKYRFYVYDDRDRRALPMVISADNDEAATEQAEKMLAGVRAELRDGDGIKASRQRGARMANDSSSFSFVVVPACH
jgi:hypothetical protein